MPARAPMPESVPPNQSPLAVSAEVLARARSLPGWQVCADMELHKSWPFLDFSAGLAFVNQIAELAELAQHHPDVLLRYGSVSVTLTTHDAGGLTVRDLALAGAIDALRVRE